MKIVNVKIAGLPQVGDSLMVHYCSPRGGRTTAGHVVRRVEERIDDESFRRRPEKLEEIIQALVLSASQQFCGCRDSVDGSFKVLARGPVMRIECKDEVDNVCFVTQVEPVNNSESTVSFEITEL